VSGTPVSSAEMDEPIAVLFGETCVGPCITRIMKQSVDLHYMEISRLKNCEKELLHKVFAHFSERACGQ